MSKSSTADQLLTSAGQLHRAGDLAGAIKLYSQVVAKVPLHATALNLLGLAYVQSGHAERAVPFLQKAVELNPGLPSGHYNLGTILQGLKRYDEARAHYERALVQQPNDAEIHSNLGSALRALDRDDQALGHFRKAIELKPGFAAAHFNLGNALLALRRHDEARGAFEAALALNPSIAQAHLNWGLALAALGRHQEALARFDMAVALKKDDPEGHLNRGDALQKLGRHADAIASYEKALALDPGFVEAHISFSAALNELRRHGEAIEHCRRALAIRPHDISASLNLANAMRELKRYDEAIAVVRQVLARSPDHGPAYFNLGTLLEIVDRNEDALSNYEHAIRLMPADVQAPWNKSHLDLSLGRFDAGWPLFEHRWAARGAEPRPYPQPLWVGGPVEGPLLVWAEQGLGDQILHSSMIEDLRVQAPSICLEVEARLVPLFTRSFPQIDVVPLGPNLYVGAVAAQIPLAGLGRHLRPGWGSFKQPAPVYLKAEPVRTAELRDRLTRDRQRVIGLSWQSFNPKMGDAKTAHLRDFAAVLSTPGCRFVDLQYGDTAVQRKAVFDELGVQVERLDDVDNLNDIDGLAALISACDLVVTVSNTTAHLAGALGKPTWVMLPPGNARLWYWFRDRGDSPWYPHAHIKRPHLGETWSELITKAAPEIAAALVQG